MRLFKIYGKWSVQASKPASKHTDTHAQCSHTSVGLAQACPNYHCHSYLTLFLNYKFGAQSNRPPPPPQQASQDCIQIVITNLFVITNIMCIVDHRFEHLAGPAKTWTREGSWAARSIGRYIPVAFSRWSSTSLKGKCCSVWMLPLATHCHTHYHLHPIQFKFKDLVAKQHPTIDGTGPIHDHTKVIWYVFCHTSTTLGHL